MRPQIRTALALLAAVAVITAVLVVHWVIYFSKNPVVTATIWTGTLARPRSRCPF
jgi:hypothetical protein